MLELLCDIYQYANKMYFESYINENKKDMEYYKELINIISEELRIQNYWR